MGGRLDPTVARARTLVRRATEELAAGSTVLVACSGGADSLALAAAAHFVAAKRGLRAGGTVVDHGLQEGSALVARGAADQLRRLGLEPVDVVPVEVGDRGGPEAAARAARYEALRSTAERHGAAAVLLGHTRDDQAESVLLGLARGSGPRSLSGMAPAEGLWRRPLLAMTRADTRLVCRLSGLEAWEDPHNLDPRYARVRVRHEVLPVLETALGPGVAGALARTAELLRSDADLLDELAAERRESVVRDDGTLDAAGLAALPASLRTRVLRSVALEAGCPASDLAAVHVTAVDRLVTAWHGQQGVDLPGGVVAVRRGGAIVFRTRGDCALARDPGHPVAR